MVLQKVKNEINNVNETYYSFNDDIALNKTSNNYSNDTYKITRNSNTFNTTDNQYFIIQAISLTISQDITTTIMNIILQKEFINI